MNTTVTKVKTNFSADSRSFGFAADCVIPARKRMKLVITSTGGPSARIHATVYDGDDIGHETIGRPDDGEYFITGTDGSATWEFPAEDYAGGYLKWRIWPVAAGDSGRSFHITEEIHENGVAIRSTTLVGTIPDQFIVDAPFLDGVQIVRETTYLASEGDPPHRARRTTRPRPEIEFRFGSSGEAVRDLQRKLATLHECNADHLPFYTGSCDGFYNRGMEKAVRDFKMKSAPGAVDDVCDAKTWHKIDEEAGSVFAEVWQFEFEALHGACPDHAKPVEESHLTRKVHAAEMAGLAFSGGGIRSATFNLGILQALAELNLLRDFHYLSTVSGGGYIGAWFSKWLARMHGDIETMEKRLSTTGSTGTGKREPEEIRFLRQYSNYLTAKTGFFSADTWSVLSTYVRNTLLNLTILVSIIGAALVIPRVMVLGVAMVNPDPAAILAFGVVTSKEIGLVAMVSVLWSVFWIAVGISARPDPARPSWITNQSQGSVIRRIVLPLMLAATLGSIALWDMRAPIAQAWTTLWATSAQEATVSAAQQATVAVALPAPPGDTPRLAAAKSIGKWLIIPGLLYFTAWVMGWILAQTYNLASMHGKKPEKTTWLALAREAMKHLKEAGGHFLCAVGALAVGSLLVILTTVAFAKIKSPPDAHHDPVAVHVLAFGMPLLLILFGITMILSVGLVGRMYSEKSREWWSRQGAWTTIFVMGWLGLASVSLYAPGLLAYAEIKSYGMASTVLGSAWIGSTVAGLLLGSSSATGKHDSRRGLELIAAAAPYIFSVGLLFLVSALVDALTSAAAKSVFDLKTPFAELIFDFNQRTLGSSVTACAVSFAAMLFTALLLAVRVDINKFSLHMMYRNRLVRAYLGASNTDRRPHPFTGFDANDDVNLDQLLKPGTKVQRPYHIVNAALNMVNGKELAWQTRKAGGFTFTPAFCGFELPSMPAPGGAKIADEALRGAYRRTHSYYKCNAKVKKDKAAPGMATMLKTEKKDDDGISLGMALAVSGAAASPNMGYHTSPALAFLMTLFNVRLGRWFANPRHPLGPDKNTTPAFSLKPLFAELFGLTDAKSEHVYLSDGGHFENLGVYELVRRRCRLIVVIDAGADGALDFNDLGNAIRKCATDLRIEIDINVSRIDLLRDAQFSRDHCVAGTIDYSKADGIEAPSGTLLYIKPSLLGSECAELLNYRKTNKAFPHQSTVDQWFDETQFESYRALGYQIGKLALGKAAAKSVVDGGLGHNIKALCQQIDALWNKAQSDDGSGTLHSISPGGDRRLNARRR